jgi:acetyl-CoA synthetase
MYWLGLQPGDVHVNISSPGWAKHAWSTFFAPWNAGAYRADGQPGTVQRQGTFRRAGALQGHHLLRAADGVASHDPGGPRCCEGRPTRGLRRGASHFNPEVINKVQEAWGLTIRDGYGQTETTAQIANSPGQKVKAGRHGPADAGLSRAWYWTPTACRPTKARSASTSTTSARPA